MFNKVQKLWIEALNIALKRSELMPLKERVEFERKEKLESILREEEMIKVEQQKLNRKSQRESISVKYGGK